MMQYKIIFPFEQAMQHGKLDMSGIELTITFKLVVIFICSEVNFKVFLVACLSIFGRECNF